MNKSLIYLFSFILLFALISACGDKTQSPNISAADKQKLIKNLTDAYTSEITASAKYEAYSKKASEEGLENIAKLFAATSKSESIHAKNHKAVLEKLGEKAPDVKPEFAVKSTKENLEESIKGETYEAIVMYPDFKKLTDAIGEYAKEASKSFEYAMRSEVKHKLYYEESLNALMEKAVDKLPVNKWVCPVCGNTVISENDTQVCSICRNTKEPWIKI
jgi:rubrerythrin